MSYKRVYFIATAVATVYLVANYMRVATTQHWGVIAIALLMVGAALGFWVQYQLAVKLTELTIASTRLSAPTIPRASLTNMPVPVIVAIVVIQLVGPPFLNFFFNNWTHYFFAEIFIVIALYVLFAVLIVRYAIRAGSKN